ncbi:ribonuclease H-like domain-containing protein [Tanacetum coccineum]|uniref:Ribonuclease H-like domain-containing protein n=1 Tax=Tanacetum coccineum TaxID=301880 RepID=A0ABQ4XFC9_9ASTR
MKYLHHHHHHHHHKHQHNKLLTQFLPSNGEVIQNGNGPVSITTDTQGQIKALPPRTVEEILARERERKARTTLLMALPKDHLAKFHKMTDAKEMWDGHQKLDVPKSSESIEIHGAVYPQRMQIRIPLDSTFCCPQIPIMRTKPGVDSLSFDDLYNNLRVFENDVKGSTASSSSTQNVAFVSENTTILICHFARECRTKGNQDSRRIDAWNSGNKDGRRSGKQEDSKALVTIDGEGVDWTSHSEEEEDYALMDSPTSGSDTKKLKRKEDLKAKVEKWHNSSKNLGKLLNTQMSANDKFGLRYGDHRYDGLLSYKNEVLQSVFMKKESDRFVTTGGMHVVPPPMTGNYMPSGPDVEIDYSQFTYGPKQSQPSESETQTSDFDTCESEYSVQTHESLPEPTVNEPKVVNQPKVWSDAPIIEEYESDSEDEHVSQPTKEQEQPSFASTNKQVKTPRETVKNQFTHSKSPTVEKKGLGYGFTARACFVCGSFSHLIRDCDFHEKRMTKQAELNNSMRMKSSQREIRPIWNNVQRVNHQNQFVPTAVLTRTGKIPVNTTRASGTKNVSTARHSLNRQAVLTSAAMKVNTVKPIVNKVRPTTVFHKTHSPFSKPFNKTTALRTNFSIQKVNTAKLNAVSAVGGKRETAVKPSAGCNWRPKRHHFWQNDYPHRALQNKGIVDSGCSRHMTGNKAYLAEYQDFNGGPVAFGGSKGYITGKGKIKTGKLDFEDVCFVKELQHFNLFSVSQMCDKKNKVLFTDSECLVLSPEFKLPDENQVLLRIPRQNNMYSFNLENIVPSGGLACLIAKATIDESNKWHRRLGHVNFKNLNKLVERKSSKSCLQKFFIITTLVFMSEKEATQTTVEAKSVSSNKVIPYNFFKGLFGPTSANVSSQDYLSCLYGLSLALSSSTIKRSTTKDAGEAPNKHPDLKTDNKPVDKEDQEFAQETENLLIQAGAAKDSSTNVVNTVSTPVSTASPYVGLSFIDPTNPEQDDSEIPQL